MGSYFESVWFRSGEVRFGQTSVGSIDCWSNTLVRKKISNFVKNFQSGMVRFGSILILGPLSCEPILDVESSTDLGCLVRVLDLESVLSYLQLSMLAG